MTPLEFYKDRIGPKWVVARRTPNILARYGEDVVCVSQQRLRQIDLEYRALYGDPYDKPRAAMYLALKAIHAHLEAGDDCRAIMLELARGALEAERQRP